MLKGEIGKWGKIMTDFVKVQQTGDGTCGVYGVACQFASIFVQAEINPTIKEKLDFVFLENLEGFKDFFHCLNRFHRIPLSHQLHPGNFGAFIQKNIHTLRDLELFVGPAMRLLFEIKVRGRDEEMAINHLHQLKDEHTEAFELNNLCKLLGLNLINFKNKEINLDTAENFAELADNPIDMDCIFNVQVLHNGKNHFDSVYVYDELDALSFNLMPVEYEGVDGSIMYVDSKELAHILSFSREINGSQIWKREGDLFVNHLINPAKKTYIPLANVHFNTIEEQIDFDANMAKTLAKEEAIAILDGAEIDDEIALEMQQARELSFAIK